MLQTETDLYTDAALKNVAHRKRIFFRSSLQLIIFSQKKSMTHPLTARGGGYARKNVLFDLDHAHR
jgi:hypothetical protein